MDDRPPRAGFADHFSAVAAGYARHRPTYPEALFEWLAALPRHRRRAWDVGTGSGQAAVALAERFAEVVATDASAAQVEQARGHPRVTYRVAPAEESGLAARSVDLVTVGQAVHWFDPGRFWPEVERVLAAGGAVAVWSYDLARVGPAVDAVVDRYYREVVGPYWPPERELVEGRYREVPFPFAEVEAPPFQMVEEWGLDRMAGYLRTWSAAKRWSEAHGGADPLAEVLAELSAAWGGERAGEEAGDGAADVRRRVTWPLLVRAGRRRGEGR